MSWLKNIIRPKIATKTKRDMPSNIWEKCPGCGDMLYGKDLEISARVCNGCGHHLKFSVEQRLEHLLDEGTWSEVEQPHLKADHLKFKDRKSYSDRLRVARRDRGRRDGIVVGNGKIEGYPLTLCLMDFDFMAGSMGTATGNGIINAAEIAYEKKQPLLLVAASGGARMQEGILSLMQMARTSAALLKLKEAGIPYFVMLTNPTTGGVTASFAMQADFTLAEPRALIGFAGPRVIQQTIGATLPEGFQTAEYLLENGMIDAVVPRQQQRQYLGNLMNTLSLPKAFKAS